RTCTAPTASAAPAPAPSRSPRRSERAMMGVMHDAAATPTPLLQGRRCDAESLSSPLPSGERSDRSCDPGEGGSEVPYHERLDPLTPTLSPPGRGSGPRMRRGLRFVSAFLLLALLVASGAFAAWVHSLGPAPLGEGLPFSTLVVDR